MCVHMINASTIIVSDMVLNFNCLRANGPASQPAHMLLHNIMKINTESQSKLTRTLAQVTKSKSETSTDTHARTPAYARTQKQSGTFSQYGEQQRQQC